MGLIPVILGCGQEDHMLCQVPGGGWGGCWAARGWGVGAGEWPCDLSLKSSHRASVGRPLPGCRVVSQGQAFGKDPPSSCLHASTEA